MRCKPTHKDLTNLQSEEMLRPFRPVLLKILPFSLFVLLPISCNPALHLDVSIIRHALAFLTSYSFLTP